MTVGCEKELSQKDRSSLAWRFAWECEYGDVTSYWARRDLPALSSFSFARASAVLLLDAAVLFVLELMDGDGDKERLQRERDGDVEVLKLG